jgi:hypothetical protein
VTEELLGANEGAAHAHLIQVALQIQVNTGRRVATAHSHANRPTALPKPEIPFPLVVDAEISKDENVEIRLVCILVFLQLCPNVVRSRGVADPKDQY